MKLTVHLYLVLRLRMWGAIPPLTQYIFMALSLVKHKNLTFTSMQQLEHSDAGNCNIMICIPLPGTMTLCFGEVYSSTVLHFSKIPGTTTFYFFLLTQGRTSRNLFLNLFI
jgi:hypothetical protein